ncbi:hypothetical protein AB5J72_38165 [Streptomyces sp. CG1]|uniref:hypothetical protein n=1 Tax=Streptomyces sp. CG1 TaxID=1287523 RepID=UPI0034E20C14
MLADGGEAAAADLCLLCDQPEGQFPPPPGGHWRDRYGCAWRAADALVTAVHRYTSGMFSNILPLPVAVSAQASIAEVLTGVAGSVRRPTTAPSCNKPLRSRSHLERA